MHCPYCNGVNKDSAVYCTYCGRNMTVPPKQNSPAPRQQASRPNTPTQGYPPTGTQQQPRWQPQQPQPVQPASQTTRVRQQQAPVAPPRPVVPPPVPPAPDPPAPFPPRTFAQLLALEQGALEYSVVETSIGNGRKKIVRIAYPRCVAWQQVATLLKALKEQQEAKFESIIIQGVYSQQSHVYAFTNGQLQLDRNVLLGSSVMNRYQIESGTGLEGDAVRIVLSEE